MSDAGATELLPLLRGLETCSDKITAITHFQLIAAGFRCLGTGDSVNFIIFFVLLVSIPIVSIHRFLSNGVKKHPKLIHPHKTQFLFTLLLQFL